MDEKKEFYVQTKEDKQEIELCFAHNFEEYWDLDASQTGIVRFRCQSCGKTVDEPTSAMVDPCPAELIDFANAVSRFSTVLCYVTGNKMSKPNYTEEAMLSVIDDHVQDMCEEYHKDEMQAFYDQFIASEMRIVHKAGIMYYSLGYKQWVVGHVLSTTITERFNSFEEAFEHLVTNF